MQKTVLSSILLFICLFTLNGQEKCDSIFFKDGKLVLGNVRIVYDDKIEFNYINEDVLNIISISKINKVVFKSGRVETFNNNIELSGISDKDITMKEKMTQLKEEHFGRTSNIPKSISWNLDIVLSDETAELCKNISNINDVLYKAFVNKMTIQSKTARFIEILGYNSSIGRSSTQDKTVRLYISHIDEDDGEIYGFISFVVKDEIVYSEYFNGNGTRGSLNAGIIKSIQSGITNMFWN